MALCPAGHESQTTDYCDICGAVMGGAAIKPTSAAASPVSASAPSGAAGSSSGAAAGGSCPQCGAARGGRFCEECGFDFELAELVPPPVQTAQTPPSASSSLLAATAALTPEPAPTLEKNPDPLAQTAPMPPDYDFDAEFAKAEREFAASGGESAPPLEPAANANANSAASQTPTAAAPARLAAVVIADHEYYAAQVERGDIIEDEFPFPKYPGERRFVLETDRVRIGRASASRGIAVEIDLTGPPLDPAVSHLHAQLLRAADGSWSVVDLNSANGTRLNGAEEPLPAETEVPVKAGDRIHLGVWTTLALEEA